MSEEKQELKPCPFCGIKPSKQGDWTYHRMSGNSCELAGSRFDITKWNTRQSPALEPLNRDMLFTVVLGQTPLPGSQYIPKSLSIVDLERERQKKANLLTDLIMEHFGRPANEGILEADKVTLAFFQKYLGMPDGTLEQLCCEIIRLKKSAKSVPSEEEIMITALDSGFMISSKYGEDINQPMPISDKKTLIKFAKALLKKES